MGWKGWLAVVAVAVILYLAVAALMFTQQRSMVYYPEFTRSDRADTGFGLQRGDVELRGWVVNPSAPAPILYFGGNAERVEANREDFARWFPHRSAYLLAYRGYGASGGEPGQEALTSDALALYDHVAARHPGEPVSVIGRSLGSGVAAHVAAHREVDRLVLVTPFDSLAAVAQGHYPWLPVRWLMTERYDSMEALARHGGPVLVLAAGRDVVVPPERTQALVEGLTVTPEVIDFPAADHNDIHLQPGYGEALSRFLR